MSAAKVFFGILTFLIVLILFILTIVFYIKYHEEKNRQAIIGISSCNNQAGAMYMFQINWSIPDGNTGTNGPNDIPMYLTVGNDCVVSAGCTGTGCTGTCDFGPATPVSNSSIFISPAPTEGVINSSQFWYLLPGPTGGQYYIQNVETCQYLGASTTPLGSPFTSQYFNLILTTTPVNAFTFGVQTGFNATSGNFTDLQVIINSRPYPVGVSSETSPSNNLIRNTNLIAYPSGVTVEKFNFFIPIPIYKIGD